MRAARSCLPVLLPALLLTACAYHPAMDRPSIEMPRTLSASGVASAPVWPSRRWWRGFGSPELDRLIAEAESRNQDLAAAAARIAEQAALAQVAGAPLLPMLGFQGNVSRQSTNGSSGALSGSYGDASLAASYELDVWGRVSATAAAARAIFQASRYDREAVALSVTASVADSYFAALSARERLAIARDNLADARQILALVEARVRDGAALPLDVAQQQALVATEEAAIPPLAQDESEALAALALLLDRPAQGFTAPGEGLGTILMPSLSPGLPSALLTRRPDIAEAAAQLAAADANVAAARAAMLPRIDLTALAGVQEAIVTGASGGASVLYTLGAGLTQPIFDNGALAGQRDYAVARRDELVAQYRNAVVAAFGDVQRALEAIDHARQQQDAQERVVTASRRAFTLAEKQYRDGATDLLTVLDTQRTLYAAQDALAQIRLARLRALVALFVALGGGWQQGDGG